MKLWPLTYVISHKVEGNDFSANVQIKGQVLAGQEHEGYVWIDGLRPSAIGDGGKTLKEGCEAFHRHLKEVLHDLAEGVSFETFERDLNDFLNTEDEYITKQWPSPENENTNPDAEVIWNETGLPSGFAPYEKGFESTYNIEYTKKEKEK